MNLKPTFFALTTALLATTAHAKAVDWTPYLKGMQDGCSGITGIFDHENITIPKSLKPSVIKAGYDETGETQHIKLKNATAFGQPLVEIIAGGAGDSGGSSLHFANANFMKLLPQFQIKDKTNPTSKYWIQEVNPSTGKVIKRHHLTNYTDKTAEEIIFAFYVGIQLQNPDYGPEGKALLRQNQRNLSANFRKHHQKLVNQLVNKYRKRESGWNAIEVYQQTKNGYKIIGTESVSTLSFDAKSRAVSCEGSYYGGEPLFLMDSSDVVLKDTP